MLKASMQQVETSTLVEVVSNIENIPENKDTELKLVSLLTHISYVCYRRKMMG